MRLLAVLLEQVEASPSIHVLSKTLRYCRLFTAPGYLHMRKQFQQPHHIAFVSTPLNCMFVRRRIDDEDRRLKAWPLAIFGY